MIPLIDIAPFLHGSASDKARTARTLDEACREVGWLVVAGHGVPGDLVAEMHAVSRTYFALPHWEKMKHKMPADRYRGYTPPGTESLAYSLDEERPPDLKEAFSMGPVDAACDAYHYGPAGARYFAPNIWPDRPAGMAKVWEAYYRALSRLSADMMRVFAVALALPEDFFAPKIDEHITNFSAIYYPPQPEAPLAGQLRGGGHTDYGSLTLVHCDTDIGGLQVQTRDGGWEGVPWFPDAFSVNLGDLMAEWTNHRWRSTMHRVVNPPRDKAHLDRLSLVFFHQPNYDAVIECLPGCVGPDNPARYARTTSGAHITAKLTKQRAPGLAEGAAALASTGRPKAWLYPPAREESAG